MLTLHVADATPDSAVLVDGAHLAAVGPYDELAAAHPDARLRRWPGILTPGLLNPYGPELLDEFSRVKVVHIAAPPEAAPQKDRP